MLEREANNKGYNLSDLLTDKAFAKLSQRMSFSGQDEMFASVGYGAVTTNQVLVKLIDYYRHSSIESQARIIANNPKQSGGVIVKGMDTILVRIEGC